MLKPIIQVSKSNRGQMFLLATLIIAVYTVAILISITNFKKNPIPTEFDDTSLIADNIQKDLVKKGILLLSKMSQNETYTKTDALAELQKTLIFIGNIYSQQAKSVSLTLRSESFSTRLSSLPNNPKNALSSAIYSNEISFIVDYQLYDLESQTTISSSFTIYYKAQATIFANNTLFIEESYDEKSTITKPIVQAEVNLINSTSTYRASAGNFPGYYQFSPNIIVTQGYLKVILPNGVYIFS